MSDKLELSNESILKYYNPEQMQDEIDAISKAFGSGDLKAAKEASVRLKYRLGVEESINARLHDM